MSRYNQIFSGLWEDEKFCALSLPAKVLFIYLFSNLRVSVSGIYKIAIKTMAFELNILESAVSSALNELIGQGLIAYDFSKNTIWIKNKIKFESATKSIFKLKAISRDLLEFKDSSFYQSFFEKYPELTDLALTIEIQMKEFKEKLKARHTEQDITGQDITRGI